jgi:hypothetical protein
MTTPPHPAGPRPPAQVFPGDPERFAIAFAHALMAMGVSENSAFLIAAAQIVGKVSDVRMVEPRRKRHRGMVPAGMQVSYVRDNRLDAPTTEIPGKAATLRQKANRSMNPEEAEWRVTMARAFMLALQGRDQQRCALEIMQLAAQAGEVNYARTVLLPLLAARFVKRPIISQI